MMGASGASIDESFKYLYRASVPGFGYFPGNFQKENDTPEESTGNVPRYYSLTDLFKGIAKSSDISTFAQAQSAFIGFNSNFESPFATSEDIQGKSIYSLENKGLQRLEDSSIANPLGGLTYRNILEIGVNNPNTPNITDFRREQRVNIGNPGNNEPKRFPYNVYDAGTVDKINALDVIRVKDGVFTDQRYRDLIIFIII